MKIEIKRIQPNFAELYQIELLRRQVFHLKTSDSYVKTSSNIFHALHNQLIPFGLTINNELVAGIYVMYSGENLLITSLFVKEEYQNTKMKLGRKLLNAVLELIPTFEEHLGHRIRNVRLVAVNAKARSIYKKMGFTKEEGTPYMHKNI